MTTDLMDCELSSVTSMLPYDARSLTALRQNSTVVFHTHIRLHHITVYRSKWSRWVFWPTLYLYTRTCSYNTDALARQPNNSYRLNGSMLKLDRSSETRECLVVAQTSAGSVKFTIRPINFLLSPMFIRIIIRKSV